MVTPQEINASELSYIDTFPVSDPSVESAGVVEIDGDEYGISLMVVIGQPGAIGTEVILSEKEIRKALRVIKDNK